MLSIRMGMRVLVSCCVVLIFVLGIAGCNIVNLSGNEQLPVISSLPLPKLPNWIEQISPVGEAAPLNQIRIRFKEALIPVENLDSPAQQQLLQKFEVIP